MEYTAFNHAAWNPLHSIWMLWAMLQKNPLHSIGMHWASLHGLHCIQLVSIALQCMESSAFNDAAWNPLHSIILHGIHCTPSCCIKSTAFNRVPFLHTAGNTMHSIGMHFNTLHGLHCCIMDYTAAIMLHIIHCIQSG